MPKGSGSLLATNRRVLSLLAAVATLFALLSGIPTADAATNHTFQYVIVFQNGTTVSGTTNDGSGNTAFVPNVGGTDSQNPDAGMYIHMSCSDDFNLSLDPSDPDYGYSASGAEPSNPEDSGWRIADYAFRRVGTNGGKCGDQDLFDPTPSISVDKVTNGSDGPTIPAGDAVVWTYTVTNTGTETLTNITVTDDAAYPGDWDPTPVCSPQANGSITLAPGESIECTAEGVANYNHFRGDYENTARARGFFEGQPVEDTDDSSYTPSLGCPLPVEGNDILVDIAANVPDNGFMQNAPHTLGPIGVSIPAGSYEVSWASYDGHSSRAIDPSQSQEQWYVKVGGATTGDTLDLPDAQDYITGDFPSLVVLDSAATSLTVHHGADNSANNSIHALCVVFDPLEPSIDITKSLTEPGAVEEGNTATFTITVLNDGEVDLTGVHVTDALTPSCDFAAGDTTTVPGGEFDGGLAVGESFSYECTTPALYESFVNVAVTSGTPPGGGEVTDEDPEPVEVIDDPASIALVKDVDQAVVAYPGDDVTFTLTVTNTSLVDTVTIDSLIDTVYGDIGAECTPSLIGTTLDPGGSAQCSFDAYIGADHYNVATVYATSDDQDELEASDDAEVVVGPWTADIAVVKTGTLTEVGDGTAVVDWLITITNTGNVTLVDLEVGDVMVDYYGTSYDLPQCETPDTTTLAPGDSTDIECSSDLDVAVHGLEVTNFVEVVGTPDEPCVEEDCSVTDEDEATVGILPPTGDPLSIEKLVGPLGTEVGSADFADGYARLAGEDAVTWEITITNTTDDIVIADLDLVDAVSPSCVVAFATAMEALHPGDNYLDPGQELVFTCDLGDLGDAVVVNVAETGGFYPWGEATPRVDDDAQAIPPVLDVTGSIGDYVWSDEDGDGIQDPDEKGIAGAKVVLDRGGDLPDLVATTDANGLYLFADLPPGTYTAKLDVSSIPEPDDGSLKVTTAGSYTVNLAEGQNYLDADFGVQAVLPVTGIEADRLALVGLALLLAGALAVLATRKEDGEAA